MYIKSKIQKLLLFVFASIFSLYGYSQTSNNLIPSNREYLLHDSKSMESSGGIVYTQKSGFDSINTKALDDYIIYVIDSQKNNSLWKLTSNMGTLNDLKLNPISIHQIDNENSTIKKKALWVILK